MTNGIGRRVRAAFFMGIGSLISKRRTVDIPEHTPSPISGPPRFKLENLRSDLRFDACLPGRKKWAGLVSRPLAETKDYGPVPTTVGMTGPGSTTEPGLTLSGTQFVGSSCVAGVEADRNAPGPWKSYSTHA